VDLTIRRAGVLLHPTSLPGPWGVGDVGPEAHRFVDWLAAAGFTVWQTLPLGPTGYGDSPYQCFSSFAGNPLLVSPEALGREGLAERGDLGRPRLPAGRVDYGPAIEWKAGLLRRVHGRFRAGAPRAARRAFDAFRRDPAVAVWLGDFALFMALKGAHGGRAWGEWPAALRRRDPGALGEARRALAVEVEFHEFCQFLFDRQWRELREAARARGVALFGDVPIYVAYDSADTWANQEYFQLRPNGRPTHVAGVPPDYFSETGQLWGNPLYRWRKLEADGYRWWIERMHGALRYADVVRLDHFRAFEGYWRVPFGEKTAVNGRWMPGPRRRFLDVLERDLGGLPIIAENLGTITPEVEALRTRYGLPGMCVLQFGWGSVDDKGERPVPGCPHVPHEVEPANVVYTGTHDNPTTRQWWDEFATPWEKALCREYLRTSDETIVEDLAREALRSPAAMAVLPVQDLLGVGAEGRMNYPGREMGNWSWRMRRGSLTRALARRWRRLLGVYGRVG